MSSAVIVIAKAPVPGRSKTRLCPPFSPVEAAHVAEACLLDTLHALRAVDARRVVALEGRPGDWLLPGFEVVPQRGEGLANRIAAAFEDVGGPAVLIGMDTPQVTPRLLRRAVASLEEADAVFAPAEDGGWWALGLREPDRELIGGVPMSTPWTGAVQHQRLHEAHLTHRLLPPLRDVDDVRDAEAIAAQIPGSHLARSLRKIHGDHVRGTMDGAWTVGRR